MSLHPCRESPEPASARLAPSQKGLGVTPPTWRSMCLHHACLLCHRWGKKPDGVCVVVGTLATGFTNNSTADVIVTASNLQPDSARVNK